MTNELPEDNQLREIEERLRSFQPVAPRTLQIRTRSPLRLALAFGVVVGLCVIAAIAVYHRTKLRPDAEVGVSKNPVPGPNPVVTVGQLNAALCAGDKDFFQLLDKTSPYILPREHQSTTLYELGKE
jgi:hypothetical protein